MARCGGVPREPNGRGEMVLRMAVSCPRLDAFWAEAELRRVAPVAFCID